MDMKMEENGSFDFQEEEERGGGGGGGKMSKENGETRKELLNISGKCN